MTDQADTRNTEIVDRVHTDWYLEKKFPLTATEEEGAESLELNNEGWAIYGSFRSDHNDLLSVLKFNRKKYPEDQFRAVRREVRHFIEEVGCEEEPEDERRMTV